MLRKEPFCADIKNLIYLVEIMLALQYLQLSASEDFQHKSEKIKNIKSV